MSRPSEIPPLAIIGMACRLPGADNLDQFWNLLRTGGSGIAEIPPDRLDRELHFHPKKGRLNKTYSAMGGLVSHRPFDRSACPLTDEQIASADVAHLTLCEVAAAACRQAGLDPFDLPLRNTGVFVGHTSASPLAAQVAYRGNVAEMAHLLQEVEPLRSLPDAERADLVREMIAAVRREGLPSPAAGRLELSSLSAAKLISRSFGLNGPFLVVDAACASSLQALAVAAASLRQGRIDMAVVGGASYCKSDTLVLFSHAQSLSARGSRPFDADADGLILAEGYVAVIVKTVARALADGDKIQAVIRGIGMSTDGRGKSLWAPRKEGQILAIQRAYEPDIDVARLQYLEAHATSTQIGDATELQALAEALGGRLPPGHKIPIGSVKANVGHTLEAAGLTGLVKTVLAMRHQTVPPVINCRRLNPEIDWNRAPFFVPTSELAWPSPGDGLARRAAVNSFGIGGLNVHVVLDEFPEVPSRRAHSNGASGQQPSLESHEPEAVAIIGAGCLLPGARTVAAFWDLLASGRDAKGPLPPGRWNPAAGINRRSGKALSESLPSGGFITDYAYDWHRHVVPPKQVEQANPLQFMLLDATEQAIEDAGYHRKPLDRSRVGVVVGAMFGDEFSQQLNLALRLPEFQQTLRALLIERGFEADEIDRLAARFEKLLLQRMPALVDETGSFTSSTLASRITKSFDFFGGGLALDAGEAAGLAALTASADFLFSGACDTVVCAAGDRNMGLLVYEAESHSGRLAQGMPQSLFSAKASGNVPGEGVGVLLLKRLSDARRDGDPIRAILRGFGAGAGDDLYQASRLAMRRALRDAHVEPAQIATLESASAQLPVVEARHSAAVIETYGSGTRATPLQLGSLVSQIGNTKAASGIAAIIKSTLALEHGELPAEVGLDQVAPWLADRRGQMEAASVTTPLRAGEQSGRLFAAVTASAEDCLAYHVILERGVALPTTTLRESIKMSPVDRNDHRCQWQIVKLTAGSLRDLAAAAGVAVAEAPALFAKNSGAAFPANAGWRLAVVADSADALATKLRLAADQLAIPQSRPVLEEQGIFCHERPQSAAKIAFLFPGQGSQYAGMLGDLVRQNQTARDAVREVDAALALLGYPSFDEISADADQLLALDVFRTQLAMLLADLVMFRTLTRMGIQPAIVSGHSYGEFAALLAAGAWSLEQAIGATAGRCQAIDRDMPQVSTQMLSAAAPADAVRQLLAGRGNIFLSHENAPDQTVVAGEAGEVQAFATRLRSAGFESRPLAVPGAFHTPLMAGAQPPFAEALEKAWIVSPRVPFMSSVSNRIESDPAEIRANLVAQLTAPVNYVDLIRRLSQSRANVLIEVGPQQVLTRLHRRILGETTVCVASDHPKRSSEQQLCRLLAQLECAGVDRDTAPLQPSISAPAKDSDPLRTQFVSLDATTRRKARLRGDAAPEAPPLSPQQPPQETVSRSESPAPAMRDPLPAQRNASPAASFPVPELEPSVSPETNGHGRTSHARPKENAPSLKELESFLVQFVIDQTGYPPEIVRLDADLEADLGIDSIKKAQLFGELGEYFDVTPTDDLRLDQFPTLRHVLDFLKGTRGKSEWLDRPAPAAATPAPEPSVPTASYHSASTGGSGPSEIRLSAVATAVAYIATPVTAAFPLSASALLIPDRPQRPKATIRAKAGAPQIEELEQFLVQFVVEQTGYPAEIVKLDADLEADLGIDSIKKAQLFGELGEFFEVSDPENLRLDEFSTLRHVMELLRGSSGDQPAPHDVTVPAVQPAPIQPPTAAVLDPAVIAAPVVAEPAMAKPIVPVPVVTPTPDDDDSLIRPRGMTYEAARQHGTARRLQIRRWLRRFAEKASPVMVEASHVDEFLPTPEAFFSEPELAELQGIADGAGVLLTNLVAHALSGGSTRQRRQEKTAPAASSLVAEAAIAQPRLTQRLVLRTMDAPLPAASASAKFLPVGAALVLGDNDLARGIAAQLSSLGVPVEIISSSHSWPLVREQFEQTWSRQPIRHLFLTTAHDAEARLAAGEAAWQRRYERGILTPFFLCQQWLTRLEDARLCDGATLVATTALGSDFGLSGNLGTIEGGAATGLLKGLFIESRYEKWAGLEFKVLDFAGDEPAGTAAKSVFQELAAAQPDVEVGYRAGRRRLVRAVEQAAGPPQPQTLPSGTWVVTGGGRGIAAIAALALARRFGLRLHLLGLSPQPDIDPSWRTLSASGLEQLKHSIFRQAHAAGHAPHEEWRRVEKALEIDRTLRACAAAGVATTYHSCDVSVWEDLDRVLQQIREVDGPISGVLHGAGVVHDAAFRRKKPAHVRETFAAKNGAAAALIELTREDPLRHFVTFGSMSGRLGMTGQADYSAANDLLCKQIDSLRRARPECHSVGIHWHAWGETGVAARPELQATFASLDIKFMPPTEGVEHLIRELESGAPESEVLFTSTEGCRKQYPLSCVASSEEIEAAAQAAGQVRLAPLIDAVSEHHAGARLTAEIRLDPVGDPFLADHLLAGKPLLPFVMGIESVAQAARMLCHGDVIQLDNIQVHNGVSFADAKPLTIHVSARMLPDGKCEARLTREFRDREGRLVDPARPCFAAEVECGQPVTLAGDPPGEPPIGWFPMAYPDEAPILHGPRLRCLTQVAIQYDGAFGQIVAPAPQELGGSRPTSGWIVPAAALDACLMLCSTFAFFQFGKRFEIPAGMARLQLARPPRPGEICLVRMYYKGQDSRSARYDFRLFGEGGDCLLSATGYQTTVLSAPTK